MVTPRHCASAVVTLTRLDSSRLVFGSPLGLFQRRASTRADWLLTSNMRVLSFLLVLSACLTLVLAVLDAPAPALALVKRRRPHRSRSRGHRSHRRHRSKSSHRSSSKSSHHGSHKSHDEPSNAIRGQPIPRELQSFVREAFKAKKCQHQLDTEKGGFQASGGSPNPHYCGTAAKGPQKAVWWGASPLSSTD